MDDIGEIIGQMNVLKQMEKDDLEKKRIAKEKEAAKEREARFGQAETHINAKEILEELQSTNMDGPFFANVVKLLNHNSGMLYYIIYFF